MSLFTFFFDHSYAPYLLPAVAIFLMHASMHLLAGSQQLFQNAESPKTSEITTVHTHNDKSVNSVTFMFQRVVWIVLRHQLSHETEHQRVSDLWDTRIFSTIFWLPYLVFSRMHLFSLELTLSFWIWAQCLWTPRPAPLTIPTLYLDIQSSLK